jgi:hypothetical protein
MEKDKEGYLITVLCAARDRADYLEELAKECEGYQDNDAARDFAEQANSIRLAVAELDRHN